MDQLAALEEIRTTIEQILIEQGLKQGLKKGREQEAVRCRRDILLRLLHCRFKKVPPRIIKTIKKTSNVEELDFWLKEFATATKLEHLSLARTL